MQATQYRIVFDGELMPGMALDTVKANLARLFKSDSGKIDRLFDQGPVNIKACPPHGSTPGAVPRPRGPSLQQLPRS